MKTHILLAVFSAFLFTACASHEGRSLSSTDGSADSKVDYAQREANFGREVSRQ